MVKSVTYVAMAGFFLAGMNVATAQDRLGASDPFVAPYLGEWTLEAEFQGMPFELTLRLFDADGSVQGALSSIMSPEPQEITDVIKTDDGLRLTFDTDMAGNPVTITIDVKESGGSLSGSLADSNGMFAADFTGSKAAAASAAGANADARFPADQLSNLDVAGLEEWLGVWSLTGEMQGQQMGMTLEFLDVDGKLGAIFISPLLRQPEAIKEISTAEDGLYLGFALNFGPQSFLVALEPKLVDGEMTGTFGDSAGLLKADFTGEKQPDAPSLVARLPRPEPDGTGGPRRARRGGPAEARVAFNGDAVRIRHGGLSYSSRDRARFDATGDGEVFTYTSAAAMKFYTDTDLHFGDTVVKAHNFAPNYPGVYSIWLRRAGDGWRLVFNEQGDAWGTMHDPEYDAAEVPLESTPVDGEPEERFTIALEKSSDDEGVIRLRWGHWEWKGFFSVGK